ncbi:DUF2510 domain-containing protein [Rhodococcus qingshengii]|uniref:DUF2510 domain-containing protein n=1 Tax=Rhodococcus qingshengii TaxID=334542 RepID=UPI0021BB12D1|nr:DUF2510 domain-containing protein [Rhodococcus qingshengii]UXF70023.1 DUF2510 domain-containing protein [Rhodococcus qingshengii]
MPEHNAGPSNAAPGWYPDPQSPSLRWWDGQTWIDKWAPASVTPVFTPSLTSEPAQTAMMSDQSEPLQPNDFPGRVQTEEVAQSSHQTPVPTGKAFGPRWIRSKWSILALAACLFLAAASTVGYFAFRTDPLELQTEQGPRSITCDWWAGDYKSAIKTPPAMIESVTLTQNTDALVEFRARFDPFPIQHKTPNTDGVLRTAVTTLGLTFSKTQSVLSRDEWKTNDNSAFNKYYLSIRLEDRFAAFLSEDNGTDIEQPKNIKIFREGQDVVIQIDPKELPLLPTGKTFGFIADTTYTGGGTGIGKYRERDCS